MTKSLQIALAGIGKIARDQHVPRINERSDTVLTATISRQATIAGVPAFTKLSDAIDQYPSIEAVVVSTTPAARYEIAREAVLSQRHVFLEKPPCATISEIQILENLAEQNELTLLASWHSRYAAGVEPARQWLKGKKIERVQINWKEDVRKWHPGQDWIFEAGGLGVFDPAINGLSIACYILPEPFVLKSATLSFPENRDTPIAARLSFSGNAGEQIDADFDFREQGTEQWEIEVLTSDGLLKLSEGGASLTINNYPQTLEPTNEYRGLYSHFMDLVDRKTSDVDIAPCIHVADAFLIGKRDNVEPFVW